MIRQSLLASALLFSAPLIADAQSVQAEQRVERVVTVAGENGAEREELEATERLQPGDRLQYTLEYTNSGDDAAENLSPVMAVPSEVLLEAGSITPRTATIEFSADGGTSFSALGELTITEGAVSRRADLEDITHVRWVLAEPVETGETGYVSYRATVR
ncbi:MAG: hypothetical protein AAGJ29_10300 [Pseudomonadota bacterium]